MKIIIRFIDALSHVVLIAFVFAVVALAVMSSLLRHYSPNINDYRQSLLEVINDKNPNLHIEAKELRSEWSLFQPELSLHDVMVTSGNVSDDLHLKKLKVKINFMKSLLKGELYFDYIEVANVDVLLVEDADGKWTFANIQNKSKENFDVVEFLNRLWLIDELLLRDLHLSLVTKNGKQVQLPMMSARLSSYRNRKQFVMNFVDGKKQLISVILNTRNKPSQEKFSAQAHLKFDDFPLQALASAFLPQQQSLSGLLSNEVWLNWKDKKLNVTGRYSLDDAVLKLADKNWAIDQARSVFYVDYADNVLTTGLRSTSIKHGGQELILGPLKFSYDKHFTLRAKTLDLQAVHYFLQGYDLSEKPASILDALDPRGRLKNIRVDFGKERPLSLKAKLSDVSVSAWNGAPELLHVNGYIAANKDSGFVDFDSKNFSMFFPRLYEKAMKFDQGSGYIDWHIAEDTVYVSGKKLQLDAASGKATGEFLFSLPKVKSEKDSPRLSLNIGLKNSAAQFRSIFIPYVVSHKLTDWLDKNIVKGELPEVAFIYHGPTNPLFHEKRTMQLWLKVKDAAMTYADGWPAVENINGEYLMDDKESFAFLKDAQSKGVGVTQVDFSMDQSLDSARIRVQADVQATSESAHHFLLSKPLASKMGHVMDSWKMIGGQAKSKVDVLAVLDGEMVDVKVNALSSVSNVKLQLPEYNLVLANVSGDILFDGDKGLSSNNLSGTFLGRPVNSVISSTNRQGKVSTNIKVHAQVEAESLAAWAEQPLVRFLSGSTVVEGNIFFGADGSGMNFSSQLKGMQVNLPRPFAKKKHEQRQLDVSIPFAAGDKEIVVNYGHGVKSSLLFGRKGLAAGVIGLGVNSTQYETGKIILSGQLKKLNADEWMGVIDRYQNLTTPAANKKNTSARQSSLVFMVKNLRVKDLQAYGQSLDSVSLDFFNTFSYWQLGVNHKDLKATLRIYDTDKPMDLHLQEVNLEFLSKKQEESGIGYSNETLSKFPDINVTIDKLINKGEDFGEWDFNIRSYDDHMALEHIHGSFKGLRLGATADSDAIMYWTFGADAKTYFKGKFVSDNIANVLKGLGYKQELSSENAEFIVESWWDGGPGHFAFNQMTARCDLKLKKGSFADVSSSSADALKFIGVFNIANLIKRLKLDFSDLTSKGLAYDTVDGTIKVYNGVYQFQKPILVKSSASKIRFYGGFDMNTEQLDVTMGVTLPLASNLPWIVALAAGLPTAAGVYIISKVMDKQVDQLSSAVYRVTGPFSEPVIKFDSLFDSEDGYEKQQQKKAKVAEKPAG